MLKVASHAVLWYNEALNNMMSGDAANTPDRIHLIRRCIMDTLPPHDQDSKPLKKRGPRSEETKQKIRQTLSGRKISQEALENRKLSHQKRQALPEYEEFKAKLSERVKDSYNDELRQKRSEVSKLSWANSREKRLAALNTPEVSAKHTARMKKRWEEISPEERIEIMAARRSKGFAGNPTKLEILVAEALTDLGVEYEAQYIISGCCVDFYVPSKRLVIEANGCYWHGCISCGFNDPFHVNKRKEDRRRMYFLLRQGYKVHAVWEHEISTPKGESAKEYFQQLFAIGFFDFGQR